MFGCGVNPSEEKTLYASRVVSVEPALCQSAEWILHLYCSSQRLLCCIWNQSILAVHCNSWCSCLSHPILELQGAQWVLLVFHFKFLGLGLIHQNCHERFVCWPQVTVGREPLWMPRGLLVLEFRGWRRGTAAVGQPWVEGSQRGCCSCGHGHAVTAELTFWNLWHWII